MVFLLFQKGLMNLMQTLTCVVNYCKIVLEIAG